MRQRGGWQSWLRRGTVATLLLALLLPIFGGTAPLVATVAAAPEAGDPGVLWSWGQDRYGQMGNGAVGGETQCFGECAPLPVKVTISDLPRFVSVATGTAHALALAADGRVWAWGQDDYGQLGDGAVGGESNCQGACSPTPTKISTMSFVAVDAAHHNSLALAADGSVWAWGQDDFGQLGDGTIGGNADCGGSCAATPQAITVPVGTTFVAIAAGTYHHLALTAGGVVWAWGSDFDGQLGDGAAGTTRNCATGCNPIPAPITGTGLPAMQAIAAGGTYTGHGFSLALAVDGSVWAWGDDKHGQLGDGTTRGEADCGGECASIPAPIAVPSGTTFVAFSASDHVLALAADGTIWSWGNDGYGQLGNGDGTSSEATPTAIAVPGQPDFRAISAGDSTSMALTVDGVAWSWGNNEWSELGFGVTGGSASRFEPGLVTMPNGVAFGSISAGLSFVVAIDPDPVPTATGAVVGTATAGDATVTLTATVTRQGNGAPVPVGGTVTFTYNGATYQGTTDAAGVATTTAPLPSGTPAGTTANAVTASYAGTVDYVSSQGSGPLVVAPGSSPSPSASPSPSNPGFADVAPGDPYYEAIAGLVAMGVIQGFDTTPPTFGPEAPVQRTQVAAMIVRALAWQGRPTGPRTFSDVPNPGDELQRAALILANACDGQGHCVARGYDDGRFGAYDDVSHAEVIAFVVRAFGVDPAHGWQVGAGAVPYTGVPAQFADWVATYHRYAGTIPDAPTTQEEWDAPASREWVAQVLWVALQSAP